MRTRLLVLVGATLLATIGSVSMHAQVSVTTAHNDIGRTGQNLNETILNTSDVNPTQFGKLFSQAVDGYVYAQPLYLPNVTIGGQSHNVVFVATEHDSVYAFDADNNGGANANPLWFASMLSAAHGAAAGATTVSSTYVGTDIIPEVGITGTPVIDPSTGTLYVVSKTLEGSTFVQRLHALDVTSGAEKFGGPVRISASVPGTGNGSVNSTLSFDPEWENQRPGLLLLNGIVYIGYASHGDNGPWHGWIFGYNAQTLQQTGAFCDSHNGVGSGIWMSGDGLAADLLDPLNHPYGRMFIPTGNGDYTASQPYTSNMDFGDSILNLDLSNGVPTPQDAFTPYNQAQLDAYDSDQASGGLMVLPTQTSGPYPNLLVQTGKSGNLYLLNRDNLGGYNTSTNQVVQELDTTVGDIGVWSSPAYWNGTVYYWGVQDNLKAFPLVNGQLTTPIKSSENYGFPGANPAISANGNTQGIVWTIETDGYATQAPAVLQAHDASHPGTTLYSSSTNPSRDNPGPAVKFTVPTIVNGKVYVGAENQISVFGLLNGQQVTAAPLVTPAGESFNGTLSVTMSDATPGATIYYTLDGTTPSVSSAKYTAPITLTASTTIQAMASASGYLQSAITTEPYVDSSQVATPVFTPGGNTFTQPVSVGITDSTTGASIYYTTDGTTPTTSSNLYTGPIVLSTTTTVKAISVASGFANSDVASATYTLNIGETGINFPVGFAESQGVMILNGSATLNDSRLQLTSGQTGQAGSAWYYQQVNVQAFTTEFTFQLSNPAGDGMTFSIQGQNLTVVGQPGSGLGYQGIPSSIAVKFDLFSNSGEGPDSTGLYLNGASPTVPATDLSATGIDLHSDDTMDVTLSYNGAILTMTIKDMVTGASFTTSWSVDIPSVVGGNTAWVGFTGGTGGNSSSQKVLTWAYSVGATVTPVLVAPTLSPGTGTYGSPQTVTISDMSTGAAVYYTTDGTTPTTSSSLYSSPITVSTPETVQAIAVQNGYINSPVASAVYSFGTAVPTPTFSLAAGTYTNAQTVSISDSNTSATIYYTTNGTVPTTSSAVYGGPIAVNTTETIQAIAVASGYINSAVGSAAYTITSGGTLYINYPSGGFTSPGMSLDLGALVTGGLLQITDGGPGEYRSAWFATPVPVQAFTTDFTFQQINPNADGMTFAIQGQGLGATGGNGGGLGYQGITRSVAVKFDLFGNQTEGSDSTGLYTNGASPTVPSIDLSNTPINLHSGHVMHAHMVYDGTNLTMTLTDTVTNGTVTEVFPVNIPGIVGGNTAYVGFTGGTGGQTSTQNVLSWSYEVPSGLIASTPTFSPAGGAYTGAQTVTIADSTPGATIYYTTNGTTPTTSSTVYSAPISVSASETLEAIAVAASYTNSAVASAAYTITPVAATPTFSPAAGTYNSTQTVAISDSTAGATIYYTTNGTTPTTSSTVYSGPISVSATETLEAIAVATGYTNSAVASAAYTISTVAATPTFSPAAGTYTTTQTVTISDATPGAAIYYTTNGSTPTTSSTAYSAPISVSATETVKAIAVATGYTNSAVASAVYTITPIAATPTFSPVAGTYTTAQTVTISDSTAGATIYYTTNGTAPTTSSTVYSGPISVSATETVKAIAAATNYANSAVGTAAYTIAPVAAAPTFSPAAGTYSTAQTVTISDSITGATIYYTTNGTTPTTSSTVYSGPISVSASETVTAIAVATGYTNSPAASAVYTITSSAATPTFSPAAGTYSSTQTVSISDSIPGAAIYYTTDGTVPTTSSAVYSGPISVSATETINAIAVAAGYSNSAVGTAAYTITSSGTIYINYPSGGVTASGLSLNSGASVTGSLLQITDGGSGENRTAWFTTPVPVQNFVTDFTFQQLNANADGMTFAIQGQGLTAAGGNGGGLGYQGIGHSLAVKFDLFGNQTEGSDSTGLYTNGASPTVPSVDLSTSPINLHSGHIMRAHMVYDGTNLTMTLTDTVTNGTVTEVFPVNIPSIVGGNTAYAGFTGGTGGSTATQNVLSWTYLVPAGQTAAATPTFSPAAGTYSSAQTVSISDSISGATIYYTTNGSTPTTSSTVYSGPITVSATETLEAIAVATGYTNSAVASAAYTITPAAATPTFSPAAGTYSSTQTVAISDSTAGATIYYTTNGTTPTTSSAVYSGPITVSASETLEAIAAATGYSNSAVASAAYTISTVAATPTFSPAAGTYTSTQTVTISDSVAGATIYYTTNGSAPTTSSTVYSGPITVSATETVKAIAVATGYTNSAVGSAAYTIAPLAATPTFSPAAGTYTTAQTVTISDSTAGAAIYYTTNGTTPTTSSAVYSAPITVSATETVKAIAAATGYTNSAVGSAAYTIAPIAAAPTFSPAAGTYSTAQTVTISDSIAGAAIYYTTNGTTPTTSSTLYSGPITVSTSETVEAIAVATGYTNSPAASAVYAITSPAATPTFSPAAGTYSSAQTVTISDSTAGATIYYTTNGSTPTTSSTVYSGPISVSTTETVKAIAAATGYSSSAVASAAYTISTGSTTYISYPANGFTTSGLSLNSGASVTGNLLQITDGGSGESRSAWFATAVPVQTFITDFTFQQLNANADGMTFTIQGQGPTAGGGGGGGLGYQGIGNSVAVKFDLFGNQTEGSDSTGLYTNGAAPMAPAVDLTNTGINFHSGHVMLAHMVYDGTNLTMTLTDTVTNGTVTEIFPVNIPGTVGGNTAYVGFTGGTGGSTATQNVLSWTYLSPAGQPAATPSFSPAAGTYSAAQAVTISDSTSGATIYYTTDGSTPTTASSLYSGPVTVGTSETVKAIAVATGFISSSVASAAYQIGSPLPAPTFSPAAGTYSSAQTVTISDSVSGASIYYTTNGTTPTTGSSLYSGPITVSATQTLQAIAVATGYLNSPVTTAAYTITSGGTAYINYPSGGFSASGLSLNSGASVTGGLLQITDGGSGEGRTAWYATAVPVQTFTTDFTFQQLNANADGMTFTIQGQGVGAVGGNGGGLGYQGIGNSLAVKFDLFGNQTEGSDSTGLYTNGASPTVPSVDLSTSPINLHSGDIMRAHMVYDGTNLTMTLTDTVTNGTVTEVFPVNIPSVVSGNTAYVGFTGGTGGSTAIQNVLSWSYVH